MQLAMMIRKKFLLALVITICTTGLLSLPITSAGTTYATYVIVNGVTLNASTPSVGGYATFDVGTHTLTLTDATLNTTTDTYDGRNNYSCLLYANGDLDLVLIGTNTLSSSINTYDYYATGIYVDGSLTISGSAEITAQHTDTYHYDQVDHLIHYPKAMGICCTGDCTIKTGNITLTVTADFTTYGIYPDGSFLFEDGQAVISCKSQYGVGIDTGSDKSFRMTGGNLSVTCESTNTFVNALLTGWIYMAGGEARFTGKGIKGVGGYFYHNVVTYTGGTFTFIGTNYALENGSDYSNATYSLTNGAIYVSTATDGSGLSRWTSPANGLLASNYAKGDSPFMYVQFVPHIDAVIPQTGDAYAPWLWAGIMLGALLGVSAIVAAVCRKRA